MRIRAASIHTHTHTLKWAISIGWQEALLSEVPMVSKSTSSWTEPTHTRPTHTHTHTVTVIIHRDTLFMRGVGGMNMSETRLENDFFNLATVNLLLQLLNIRLL